MKVLPKILGLFIGFLLLIYIVFPLILNATAGKEMLLYQEKEETYFEEGQNNEKLKEALMNNIKAKGYTFDEASYTFLGYGYFKDKTSVFWDKYKLENADPSTFIGLGYISDSVYGKDKNHVYIGDNVIEWHDAPSFQRLGSDYWKDKHGVYYLNYKIPGADPTSFQVIKTAIAKDKNFFYCQGEKIGGTAAFLFLFDLLSEEGCLY